MSQFRNDYRNSIGDSLKEGKTEERKEITRGRCASHVTNKKRTAAKEVTATDSVKSELDDAGSDL